MQMRIAAHHDRCASLPTCAHSLPSAFVMPAVYHHRVKALSLDNVFDLGRIKSTKSGNARPPRNVAEKAVRITIEQRNIPVKVNAKARSGLLRCCCLTAIANFNTEPWFRREPSEPLPVILNRVCTNNRQSLAAHSFLRCQPNPSMPRASFSRLIAFNSIQLWLLNDSTNCYVRGKCHSPSISIKQPMNQPGSNCAEFTLCGPGQHASNHKDNRAMARSQA